MISTARLGGNDVYYRALIDINLNKLRELFGRSGTSVDDIRTEFQSLFGLAIENARNAISFDETNYLNWVALAHVYESVVSLGIDGAYENSMRAYEEAQRYNPKSPVLHLLIAQLELARGDSNAARAHIGKALALKNNYTEAIFLLSQIEADEGKIPDAIASAEIASLISPNDTGLFFHLGLLRYTNKDYLGAVSAFERAIILQSNYSNAKYFLGLSYYELGRKVDAVTQFSDIVALNPNNTEAKQILTNIQAGRRPFDGRAALESAKNLLNVPIPE
jgi:tetratricopeptide (TPR) repeat protein